MWALILVVLAAGASAQRLVPLDVVPGGRIMRLNAQNTDTIYELKTAPASRIIAVCLLDQSAGCQQTVFHASVDGRQWVNVCNVTQPAQFLPSEGNLLKIRVASRVHPSPVVCEFSATKPYVGLHGGDPDSSEHGIEGLTAAKPSCRCGWSNKRSQRIVGGKIAEQNEFSFPIRMLVNGQPICGGSIITQYHVLSAAHCTEPLRGQRVHLAVVVGEHHISHSPHRVIHDVANVFDHQGYDKNIFVNDITILLLAKPIQFNNLIGPVCMPTGFAQNLVNDHIKIIGWGRTLHGGEQSLVLKKLNLRVLDPEICGVVYPNFQNNGQKVCTYRDLEGACQGDSGGPLVWRSPSTNMFIQAALVSYGRVCAAKDPSVNTDVRHYMPWITRIVQATSPKPTKMCYSS